MYVNLITDLISNEVTNDMYSNPSLLWENLKYKIRKLSINYSKEKARERRRNEVGLTNRISLLEQQLYISDSDHFRTCLKNAQAELRLFYEYKLQGTIIRSLEKWVEKGEKILSTF